MSIQSLSNGLEACIAGDILDEVANYLDGDLLSSLAPASRTLATAVDHCAARRCRALWSTSAEIEALGVRLGSPSNDTRSGSPPPPPMPSDTSSASGASLFMELRGSHQIKDPSLGLLAVQRTARHC